MLAGQCQRAVSGTDAWAGRNLHGDLRYGDNGGAGESGRQPGAPWLHELALRHGLVPQFRGVAVKQVDQGFAVALASTIGTPRSTYCYK